jgi:hypothetical protein
MILLEMGAAPNGLDPRVTLDGADVTARVASVELLPTGVAVLHLFAEPQELELIQPIETAPDAKIYGLKRQVVQQKYRAVSR